MEMKKKILGFITGLFLIVGLTNSGIAASGNWLDWYVDWDGIAGGATAQTSGHFDVDSPNVVVFESGDSGFFYNYGLVTIFDDGVNTLTGKYELSGTEDEDGFLSFYPGGTLELFVNDPLYDDAKATLSLVEGQGFYNGAIQNGFVSLTYELTSITDGYFFWANSDSPWVVGQTFFTSTTNMIPNNDEVEIAELKVEFDGVEDNDLFLASGGQVGATVPVPSAFLLLGSGIIGLIGFRRKNS